MISFHSKVQEWLEAATGKSILKQFAKRKKRISSGRWGVTRNCRRFAPKNSTFERRQRSSEKKPFSCFLYKVGRCFLFFVGSSPSLSVRRKEVATAKKGGMNPRDHRTDISIVLSNCNAVRCASHAYVKYFGFATDDDVAAFRFSVFLSFSRSFSLPIVFCNTVETHQQRFVKDKVKKPTASTPNNVVLIN